MPKIDVLLVDDEEELVSALKERLELRDITTEYVLDGEQALLKVQQKQFDVVVIDVMMPNMNGLEVLQKIKKIRPKTQVILLTGRGKEEDNQLGIKYGAYDYVMKPLNIDKLIEIMYSAVEGQDA